ncbi:MAG: hypothetical protein IPI40_05470 [Betaproteobacteria bacterium]|nr:hypothetical protein [Betaproteobacteria bacterium]
METAGNAAPPDRMPLSTRSSRRSESTAAIDQFSKATKQVVNLADAGVRAAATATKAAAPKGRKAA